MIFVKGVNIAGRWRKWLIRSVCILDWLTVVSGVTIFTFQDLIIQKVAFKQFMGVLLRRELLSVLDGIFFERPYSKLARPCMNSHDGCIYFGWILFITGRTISQKICTGSVWGANTISSPLMILKLSEDLGTNVSSEKETELVILLAAQYAMEWKMFCNDLLDWGMVKKAFWLARNFWKILRAKDSFHRI